MQRPALHPRPSTPDEIVETFLAAYCAGMFPMAELPDPPPRASRATPIPTARTIGWYAPDPRAILPLDSGELHIGRTIRRTLRRANLTFTSDAAFERVIRACAAPAPYRGGGWLDETLIRCYTLLHQRGHAHSLESWATDGATLLGGIYGVSIGAAFFAESMFSDLDAGGSGASSSALVALWHHLRDRGYQLLDVQIANDHTRRFGVTEIPRAEYARRLAAATSTPDRWRPLDPHP